MVFINVAPESSPNHLESPESLPPDMAWFLVSVMHLLEL